MSGERIRTTGDAKELQHHYHKVKPGHSDTKVPEAHWDDHKMAGVGMDGFEIDRDAMVFAQGKLASLREELQSHLHWAEDLSHPLPDGTSKVAHTMRKAYRERASMEQGVQGILRDYLKELETVQAAIGATLQVYDALDAAAAQGVGRTAPEVGQP